ncbi:MAG TPA: hypothetical protein VKH19_04205 [Gemmatimonadaceae bacterium]|nr:hypothetical protein [Gemmatimonadaceae bacterium]
MTHTRINRLTRLARPAVLARTVGLAALLVACSTDQILDVTDIDVAKPEVLTGPTALPSLLAGAIGTFGSAYNGANTDVNQISLSGMISDEFINTETFPTRIEIDIRHQNYQTNGSLSGLFYETQRARALADKTAEAYAEFDPTNVGFAEALNISALSLVLMAENYCSAIPLSKETSPGVFEYGPSLTTRAILDRAILKTDSAMTIATTGTQNRLARVIKARAQLDLDQPAAASTTIGGTAGVPTSFQYIYQHSQTTGRQNNGTWSLVQNSGRYGVGQVEGVNGLPYRVEGDTLLAGGIKDPRVANIKRASNGGNGFDGATPEWFQLKYPKRDTLVIVADGVEARLIEAEAQLRAGNYAGMLATLTALNSDATVARLRGYNRPIPALVDLSAGTVTQQQDQFFKQRAYWLYLTSHRLGDMRRLTRPATATAPDISGYGRGIETVFPTGAYHKAGTYGTDVSSPIPQAEDNNPNFVRAACDIAKP